MLVETAIALIENLAYFPGWKLTATDHTNRFENTVCVKVDYVAQETGRDNARCGYPETISTYARFPIVVDDCDDSIDLYRKVANGLLKIYAHEMREALRVGPSYWAPFHPHNIDGIRRWNATANVSDDDLFSDLQFGIA